jgi:uncharacterized membrane protein YdjX (TVP38/TMEM64 family)
MEKTPPPQQTNQTRKIASRVFWVLITIIPIIGLILSFTDPVSFYETQEQFRDKIATIGILAPLFFIILQALQVIITPISHYSVGVAGGFLYGPFLGALLNYIGRVIGHIIAFFIARLLGRKVAEKFVAQKTLEKYDKYVSGQSLILFLIYFLPIFPDDEISYLAGLSKMKFRMFFFANVFGHVGGSLGLAYLGSGIDTKDTLFWVLSVVTLAGFPILWWLMRKRKAQVESVQTPPPID